MKAMGYAKTVIESISGNETDGTLNWTSRSGDNTSTGSLNIKNIKVNSAGNADYATYDSGSNIIANTYAKKSDGLITSISISDFYLVSDKTSGSRSYTELPITADGNMGVRYYYLQIQSSKTINVGYNIFKIDIYLICNDASDSDSRYTLKCGGTVTTNVLNSGNKTTCSWAFIKPILGVTLGMLRDNDGDAGRTYKNTGKDDNSMQINRFYSAGNIRSFTVEYDGSGGNSVQSVLVARVFYEK